MKKCVFGLLVVCVMHLYTCEKPESDPAPASPPDTHEQIDAHIPHSPACSNLELAEIFDSLTLAEQLAAQVESQNPRLAAVVLHKRTVSASYREARRARMLQTTPPSASEHEPKRSRDESEDTTVVHDAKRAHTVH